MSIRAWMALATLTACAPTTPAPTGPTVRDVSRVVRMCLTEGALSPGDELRLHRPRCRPSNVKNVPPRCGEELAATARVVEPAEAGCATVRLPADGAIPRDGDRVEVVRAGSFR